MCCVPQKGLSHLFKLLVVYSRFSGVLKKSFIFSLIPSHFSFFRGGLAEVRTLFNCAFHHSLSLYFVGVNTKRNGPSTVFHFRPYRHHPMKSQRESLSQLCGSIHVPFSFVVHTETTQLGCVEGIECSEALPWYDGAHGAQTSAVERVEYLLLQ